LLHADCLAAQEATAALLIGHLRLQLRDLRLGGIQRVLLQQAALHQQIKRIGLTGQTLANQTHRLADPWQCR
jgi:1,6-anhydro-N-acetylmuramate kinase